MELYFWICNFLHVALSSVLKSLNMFSCFALHMFLFAVLFCFLIVGKIVCKISILQAGVELDMLNTHGFIYCV